MSRCRIMMGVCVCALLAILACVSPLRADRNTDAGPPDQLTKCTNASIQYEGPGHVVILNNGWVLIEKGRDAVLRDEDGEAYVTTPSELLSLQFDLKDLSLIDNHGQMFLDQAGRQMEAQGLSWHEVDATRFEEVEQLPTGCGMFSLASLTGDLTLSYDGISGKFELTFCVPETEDAPAQEFHVAGRIPAESAHADTPETLDETAETKPGCQSPECTGGGSCSFSGTCAVGKVPVCYCDGPNAVCECIKPIKKNCQLNAESIGP